MKIILLLAAFSAAISFSIFSQKLDIKVTELPAPVMNYENEHYEGNTIKSASKITKAEGTMNYEAAINGRDVIFDTNENL